MNHTSCRHFSARQHMHTHTHTHTVAVHAVGDRIRQIQNPQSLRLKPLSELVGIVRKNRKRVDITD